MEKFRERIKTIVRYFIAQKTNLEVRRFNKKDNTPKFSYIKNVWNKNYSWDYYYQRHSNSERSKYYVPYDYYTYKVQPYLNNNEYSLYVFDKNMYDKVFGNMGVKLPKTFFRCYNYVYMDGSYCNIDDINSYVSNIDHNIIIKMANHTSGGKDVEKYIFKNGKLIHAGNNKEFNVEELKNKFDGNFIVQEEIIQHKDLAKFHPYSLNSLRIESYRSVVTNEVHVLMGAMRFGSNKSFVDNVSNGGYAVGIKIDNNNEAKLREFCFQPFSNDKFSFHADTGIKFKDSIIPNFPLVVEAVKKLSNAIAYQRVISWDFSVDEEGKPVLIELNKTGGIWGPQELNEAPFFGKFSEEVKEYLDKI